MSPCTRPLVLLQGLFNKGTPMKLRRLESFYGQSNEEVTDSYSLTKYKTNKNMQVSLVLHTIFIDAYLLICYSKQISCDSKS